MSAVIPDPTVTDWVPMWSLGGQGALVFVDEKLLGAAATSVTFSAIPQTYKHLLIVWDALTDNAADQNLNGTLNGDGGANYDYQLGGPTGATVVGANNNAQTSIIMGVLATTSSGTARSSGVMEFPNYTGAFRKSVIARYGTLGANARAYMTYGQWRNGAALSSITLTAGAGNIIAGSRFTLYALTDWVAGQAPSGGADLAYAEQQSNVNITATTEATAQMIVALPATTFDGTPIWVEFFCPAGSNTSAAFYVDLYDGSSPIGFIAQGYASSGQVNVPIVGKRKLSPAPGSHTYSARGHVSSGTSIMQAGLGGSGAFMPIYLRAFRA